MTESEMNQELAKLEASVESLRDRVGDLDRDVGVTKHAVANIQQTQSAVAVRLDKLEERLGQKIDILSDKIVTVNTQQQRGLGFVAGMTAVVTVGVTFALAVAKLLFLQ